MDEKVILSTVCGVRPAIKQKKKEKASFFFIPLFIATKLNYDKLLHLQKCSSEALETQRENV